MKKRFLTAFVLSILTLCFGFTFIGCGLFEEKYTEVSTLEELKSASDNIKLVNDIDCEYETMQAIYCKKFDGQGYAIKNCIVTSNNYNRAASFFNYGVDTVKDVTFENITIQGSKGLGAAIVSVGNSNIIENVHVKNSIIKYNKPVNKGNGWYAEGNCIGGIYGGYYPRGGGNPTKSFDCKIINCSVDNVEIEISDSVTAMYVGGIAGGDNNISGCSVTSCKLTAIASDIYDYPYVGGIVGYSEGSIENSFTKDCSISANANYYSKGSFSLYSTSCAYLGGIAAYIKGNGNTKYCYGDNNSFYAKSSGDVYVGGLIGYADKTSVNQSYTKGTYISMDKYAEDNANSVSRRAGGLIGSSNNNSVISCFAYNDNVLAEQCSGFKNSTDSKVAGLIAGFNTISVMNCATYNNSLVSVTIDEFIPYELDGINKCYVSNTKFGNINNLEVLSDGFWNAPNTIKSSLNLVGIYWQLTTNNLPYLEFEEIE